MESEERTGREVSISSPKTKCPLLQSYFKAGKKFSPFPSKSGRRNGFLTIQTQNGKDGTGDNDML